MSLSENGKRLDFLANVNAYLKHPSTISNLFFYLRGVKFS